MKIGHRPDASPAANQAERKLAAPPPPDLARQIAAPPPPDRARQVAAQYTQTSTASTQVAISNAGLIAAAQGGEDGSFDAAKVARISKAINEGKFTINPGAIADKLVSNAQELLGATAGKH